MIWFGSTPEEPPPLIEPHQPREPVGITFMIQPKIVPIAKGAKWNYANGRPLTNGTWRYTPSKIEITRTPASPSNADTSIISTLDTLSSIELKKDEGSFIEAFIAGDIKEIPRRNAIENKPENDSTPNRILGDEEQTYKVDFFALAGQVAIADGKLRIYQGQELYFDAKDANIRSLLSLPIGTWIFATERHHWVRFKIDGDSENYTDFSSKPGFVRKISDYEDSDDLFADGDHISKCLKRATIGICDVLEPETPSLYEIPIRNLREIGHAFSTGDACSMDCKLMYPDINPVFNLSKES